MYSPYCLTQVNCLILFHCLGLFSVVETPGFYCAASVYYLTVYLLYWRLSATCLSLKLYVNSATLVPPRSASLPQKTFLCVSIAHGFGEKMALLPKCISYKKKKEGSMQEEEKGRAQG